MVVPVSETISFPSGANRPEKAPAPALGLITMGPNVPFGLMWNVSILLVRRSTTARVWPSGLIEIDDPPAALAERNAVESAMGSS